MSFEENIKNTRNMEGFGVWRYCPRVEARRKSSFLKPRNKAKTKKKSLFFTPEGLLRVAQ